MSELIYILGPNRGQLRKVQLQGNWLGIEPATLDLSVGNDCKHQILSLIYLNYRLSRLVRKRGFFWIALRACLHVCPHLPFIFAFPTVENAHLESLESQFRFVCPHFRSKNNNCALRYCRHKNDARKAYWDAHKSRIFKLVSLSPLLYERDQQILPKFASMPTKHWLQVEVGNEIVMHHSRDMRVWKLGKRQSDYGPVHERLL